MTKPNAQDAAESSVESAGTSQDSQQPNVHNSSSPMWLIAGVPALLILAFILYRSVVQADSGTDPAADPSTGAEAPTSPGSPSGAAPGDGK